jgi:hypothetical protein
MIQLMPAFSGEAYGERFATRLANLLLLQGIA